jgi:hypothetical protein
MLLNMLSSLPLTWQAVIPIISPGYLETLRDPQSWSVSEAGGRPVVTSVK